MKSVATAIETVEFDVVRRGYETNKVDGFLKSIGRHVTALEDQLRQAQVKVASLEKTIAGIKEREEAAETAYFAAAEAKQNLLKEAEARAAEILREATAGMPADDEDAERMQREAEQILLQSKKQLKAVERERAAAESQTETIVRDAQRRADELVAAATDEGRSIVTEARRVALETVSGSQRDAEELLAATRTEQDQIIEHIRALKEAVADMLESGAQSSERIRVILGDASVATEAVADASRDTGGGAAATA